MVAVFPVPRRILVKQVCLSWVTSACYVGCSLGLAADLLGVLVRSTWGSAFIRYGVFVVRHVKGVLSGLQ